MLIGVLPWLCLWDVALGADYWNYAYKDVEVTTDENSTRAMAVAHIIARFDVALSSVMPLTHADVSVHVYDLAPRQARDLIGQNSDAAYQFTGYEVNIVSARVSSDYWGRFSGMWGAC